MQKNRRLRIKFELHRWSTSNSSLVPFLFGRARVSTPVLGIVAGRDALFPVHSLDQITGLHLPFVPSHLPHWPRLPDSRRQMLREEEDCRGRKMTGIPLQTHFCITSITLPETRNREKKLTPRGPVPASF